MVNEEGVHPEVEEFTIGNIRDIPRPKNKILDFMKNHYFLHLVSISILYNRCFKIYKGVGGLIL